MSYLASFFYEATTGFYITAKGYFSAGESLAKVFRLPVLYAFTAALALNLSGIALPTVLAQYAGWFKIAYSILMLTMYGG